MPKPSVLQYEFFHVGGKGVEFGKTLREVGERFREDIPFDIARGARRPSYIRTTIRIHDPHGYVRILARKSLAIERALDGFRTNTQSMSFPLPQSMRALLSQWRTKRLIKYKRALAQRLRNYALESVAQALKSGSGLIAIEECDNTFRVARRNELSDLTQRVGSGKSFWLFVFDSSDLLGEDIRILHQVSCSVE